MIIITKHSRPNVEYANSSSWKQMSWLWHKNFDSTHSAGGGGAVEYTNCISAEG